MALEAGDGEGGKEEVWPAREGSGEGMKELMKDRKQKRVDRGARDAPAGVFACVGQKGICVVDVQKIE